MIKKVMQIVYMGILFLCIIKVIDYKIGLITVIIYYLMKGINKFKKNIIKIKNYNEYWILYLIETNTINSSKFENWISGFEHRYSNDDLEKMKNAWNKRKHNILFR